MARLDREGGVDFSGPAVLTAGAITSCLLWGSAIPFVRMGYQLLGIDAADTGSQLLFAGTRFFLAGLAVAVAHAVATRSTRVPSRRDLWAAFRISLFQTFGQYLLYYIGLAHSTGVNGAISQGIDVFASLVISAVIFRMERLTPQKVVGALIGFCGILLADAGSRAAGAGGGFTLTGEGFVMLATVSSALASVLTRKYAQDTDPMVLCGWQFMMGGVGCSPAASPSTATSPHQAPPAWASSPGSSWCRPWPTASGACCCATTTSAACRSTPSRSPSSGSSCRCCCWGTRARPSAP